MHTPVYHNCYTRCHSNFIGLFTSQKGSLRTQNGLLKTDLHPKTGYSTFIKVTYANFIYQVCRPRATVEQYQFTGQFYRLQIKQKSDRFHQKLRLLIRPSLNPTEIHHFFQVTEVAGFPSQNKLKCASGVVVVFVRYLGQTRRFWLPRIQFVGTRLHYCS